MQNMCRACLKLLSVDSLYHKLDDVESSKSTTIKKMLASCIPEMALDIMSNMVVCGPCALALCLAYEFRNKCLESEKKLRSLINRNISNVDFSQLLDVNPETKQSKVSVANASSSNKSQYHPKTLYRCTRCDKTFISEIYMKKHLAMHDTTKIIECEICGQCFSQQMDFQDHIATHTDEDHNEKLKSNEIKTQPTSNKAILISNNKPVEHNYCTDLKNKSLTVPVIIINTKTPQAVNEFETIDMSGQSQELYFNENIEPESQDMEIRRKWLKEEAQTFLGIYKKYVPAMQSALRKKDVWQKITAEMLALNIMVTADQCENKWKSLLKTYRYLKNYLKQNPKRPFRFQFYGDMEEILRDNDSFENNEDNSASGFTETEIETSDDLESRLTQEAGQTMIEEQDVSTQPYKTWVRQETLALMDFYEAHIDDMIRAGRKKDVWNIIAEDMASKNYQVTGFQCEKKWKNLTRTYKTIVEAVRKQDRRKPIRFPHVERMRDILLANRTAYENLYKSLFIYKKREKRLDSTPQHDDKDIDTTSEANLVLDDRLNYYSKELLGKSWGTNEVLGLINLYGMYRYNSQDSGSKKTIWKNISTELAHINITASPIQCQMKWKNLRRTYLAIKCRALQHPDGKVCMKFAFFKEMEAVFESSLMDMSECTESFMTGQEMDDDDFYTDVINLSSDDEVSEEETDEPKAKKKKLEEDSNKKTMNFRRRCEVKNCKVRGDHMHAFPNPRRQLHRFKTWVAACGNPIISKIPDKIYPSRRICHVHFEDKYIIGNCKLTVDAIPTLHLPDTPCPIDSSSPCILDLDPSTVQELHFPSIKGKVGPSYTSDIEASNFLF